MYRSLHDVSRRCPTTPCSSPATTTRTVTTSTIGDEKRTNMMLRFRNLKDFLGVMSPLRF